jgi:hypothetical protein
LRFVCTQAIFDSYHFFGNVDGFKPSNYNTMFVALLTSVSSGLVILILTIVYAFRRCQKEKLEAAVISEPVATAYIGKNDAATRVIQYIESQLVVNTLKYFIELDKIKP